MIGFNYITNWESGITPTISLILGVLGFFSFVGLGNIITNFLKLKLQKPWDLSLKLLIGIYVFSFINQIPAIASLLNSFTIYIIIFLHLVFSIYQLRKIKLSNFKFPKIYSKFYYILFFIFFIKLLFCLVPTTKVDELYYHMLLPVRLITDENLTYYQLPWPGAILPHMHYQFVGTPFYFLGFPDSLNVISLFIYFTFVYSFSIFIREQTQSEKTSLWFALIISCGLYGFVDIPTNASNAMMLLSGSISSIIISKPKYFLRNDIKSISIFFSFLLLGMVGSKISMIPISFIIYLIFLKNIYTEKGVTSFFSSFKITFLIFGIFYLPLIIFTYLKSGSPYGPVPGIFQNKSSISSDIGFFNILIFLFTKWSSLIWISWITLPFSKISKFAKINIGSVFLIQLFIVITIFSNDPRFFGGIQYAAFVLLTIRYGPFLFLKFKKLLISFLMVITLPLITLDLYYASPLIYAAFSNEERFKLKYIPLYDDFKNVDKLIEKNAQIVYSGFNVNSFHSPRKAFMNYEDIKNYNLPTYLFTSRKVDELFYNKYKIVSNIYSKQNANIYCYRSPNKKCKKANIFLYKLKFNN